MSLEVICFGILPIVFFVLVDMRYGMKAGIYASIVSAIIVLSWLFVRMNQIDYFILADGLLLCALGLLSIRLNNPRYFKFQPTIIGTILGLYACYFQVFSEPLMVHYIPSLQAMTPPETAVLMTAPAIKEAFSLLSLHLIILFFAHAALCGLSALRWSNVAWMIARLSIYPLTLIIMVIDCVGPLAKVMQDR